ncbi:MAG: hypothetical protein UX04_C0002G0040 [Microgenomates group bacterium GW2011_GWF2_45_18]|nr:MAG: hypothetical protein UW18_C0001G0057 [Microgenomates group bacterium GW2011_GWF1_44_10]KKU01897.1 MAG: hypothetical protein UX04_C0002G0040 [Microgenomates group bacterium GW2011_GWF2_45_18]OGJ40252.1 MAG: hypothetical protein A2378_03475 [Candidatus Pacebacteria bacterium RIFOXYB1_FULL_44_10]HAU98786.1 hypothetical protein [Candidatus Paceibacterota bacterium]HAX01394.1 hypothetical protein [Candidatus Paceibacterota bacterium]
MTDAPQTVGSTSPSQFSAPQPQSFGPKKQAKATFYDLRRIAEQTAQRLVNQSSSRTTLELTATVLSIVLLATLAIRPTLLTMSDLLKQIEDRQKTTQLLSEKISVLSSFSTELPPLKAQINNLHRTIPNTPEIEEVVKRIERIGSDQGIRLSSIQMASIPENLPAPEKNGEIHSAVIQVRLLATYPQIRSFIQAVEKADRMMKVQSVSIATLKNADEVSIQNASLEVHAFFVGQPVEKTIKKKQDEVEL